MEPPENEAPELHTVSRLLHKSQLVNEIITIHNESINNVGVYVKLWLHVK